LGHAGLRLKGRDLRIPASLYPLLGAASRRFGGNSAVDGTLAAILPQIAGAKNRTKILSLPIFLRISSWCDVAPPDTNV